MIRSREKNAWRRNSIIVMPNAIQKKIKPIILRMNSPYFSVFVVLYAGVLKRISHKRVSFFEIILYNTMRMLSDRRVVI